VGLEDGDGALFGHLKGEQPIRSGSAGRYSDGGDSDAARSKLVFFGADGEGGEDDDGDSDGSAGGRPRGGPPLTSHLQERRSRFQLEELLRASAEMVGRGSLGTVYRLPSGAGRRAHGRREAAARRQPLRTRGVPLIHRPHRPAPPPAPRSPQGLLLRQAGEAPHL
jgi:hypothetical protein